MALAEPTVAMTLTSVGNVFSMIQAALEKLRDNMRRRFRFKIAWTVECNDQAMPGHDHHIHAASYGTVPDASLLSAKAQEVGFGRRVEVEPVRSAEAWGEYLFKQVRDGDLQHHLDMNGGRLGNWSNNYWRVDGEPTSGGVDGALAEMRRKGLG